MASPLEGKGYMDNFYSSVPLYLELNRRKFEATGTVRSNRKGIPKVFQNKKLKKGKLYNSTNIYLFHKVKCTVM